MTQSGKQVLREAAHICIIAVLLGFAINAAHPRGFLLVGRAAMREKRIVRLSLDEARLKHAAGAAVFVDARTPEEFREGRIAGAINVPAGYEGRLYRNGAFLLPALQGDREIVLYCDGVECGAAEELARKMIGEGYPRNLYIVTDGYPAWKARGLPVAGK